MLPTVGHDVNSGNNLYRVDSDDAGQVTSCRLFEPMGPLFEQLGTFLHALRERLGFCAPGMREPRYPSLFQPVDIANEAELALGAVPVQGGENSLSEEKVGQWQRFMLAIDFMMPQVQSLGELAYVRTVLDSLAADVAQVIPEVTEGGGFSAEDAQHIQTVRHFLSQQKAVLAAKVLPTHEWANLNACDGFLDLVERLLAGEYGSEIQEQLCQLTDTYDQARSQRKLFVMPENSETELMCQQMSVALVEVSARLACCCWSLRQSESVFYSLDHQKNADLVRNVRVCRTQLASLEATLSRHEARLNKLLARAVQGETMDLSIQRLSAMAERFKAASGLAKASWQAAVTVMGHMLERLPLLEQSFPDVFPPNTRSELLNLQAEVHQCHQALMDADYLTGGEALSWRMATMRSQQRLVNYRQRVAQLSNEHGASARDRLAHGAGSQGQFLVPEMDRFLDDLTNECEEVYNQWSGIHIARTLGVPDVNTVVALAPPPLFDPDVAVSALTKTADVLAQIVRLPSAEAPTPHAAGLQAKLAQRYWALAVVAREAILDFFYWQVCRCDQPFFVPELSHLQEVLADLACLQVIPSDELSAEAAQQQACDLKCLLQNSRALFQALPVFAAQIDESELTLNQKTDLAAWLSRLYMNSPSLLAETPDQALASVKMLSGVFRCLAAKPELARTLADQVLDAAHNAACTDWASAVLLDMQAIIEADVLAERLANDLSQAQAGAILPEDRASENRCQADRSAVAINFVKDNRQALLRLLRFSAFKQFLTESPSFQRGHGESIEQALYLFLHLKQTVDLPGDLSVDRMQYHHFAEHSFGKAALARDVQLAKQAMRDDALAARGRLLLDNLPAFGVDLWASLTAMLPKDPERVARLAAIDAQIQQLVAQECVSDTESVEPGGAEDAEQHRLEHGRAEHYRNLAVEKEGLLAEGLVCEHARNDLWQALGL